MLYRRENLESPVVSFVEMGEGIGAFAVSAVAAATVPTMAALFGGPIALGLSTLMGSLTGLVAGSLEENTIGVGRTVGELAGAVLDAAWKGAKKLYTIVAGPSAHSLQKGTEASDEAPAVQAAQKKSIFGKALSWAGKAFMKVNGAMAEPLMGYIIDLSSLFNKILREKPVQCVEFNERPMPSVNRERLIDNFVRLTGMEAVYGQESIVAEELKSQFKEMGVGCNIDRTGNLIASIPPSKGYEDSPAVLFSAHMDTVAPTSKDAIVVGKNEISTDERHILGGDDRAGIAQIMEGVNTVLEQGLEHPEIKIVFTVGEEVGLKGSGALKKEDISTKPTLGFIIDSTDKQSVFLANDSVMLSPQSVRYNFSQEDPLVQVGIKSLANAGIRPNPIHGPILAGAGTDANSPAFNNSLIRSMAIGTGVSDIHSPLEHVKKDDLEQVARAVVGMITNSCDLMYDGDNRITPRLGYVK